MVHITDAIIDTKAQQVVSYTSARITELMFAHEQHREEQNILSSLEIDRYIGQYVGFTDISVSAKTADIIDVNRS